MSRLEMLANNLMNKEKQEDKIDKNIENANTVFDKLNFLSIGDHYIIKIKNNIEQGIIVFKYELNKVGCLGICVILDNNHKIKYHENPNIDIGYNLEIKERDITKKNTALDVYTRYIYIESQRYEESSKNITYEDLSDDEIGKKYTTDTYGNRKDIKVKEQVIAELKYRNEFGALVLYNQIKAFDDGKVGERDFVEWVHFPKKYNK